jgi:predicted SAM-dependent methyltransferase
MKRLASLALKFQRKLREHSIKAKVAGLAVRPIPLKIEIGSGPKTGSNGWTTLDTCKECDLNWDLRYGIPLPESSVGMIYASHVFEHFYFCDLLNLLRDCRRVLVLGGEMLIAVPNARLYVDAYCQGLDYPPKELVWSPGMPNTMSAIDKLNYMAYMGGHHKYMFDQQNLLNILNMCGFQKCSLREFDPKLDILERHFETIYARAEK